MEYKGLSTGDLALPIHSESYKLQVSSRIPLRYSEIDYWKLSQVPTEVSEENPLLLATKKWALYQETLADHSLVC